GMPYAVLMPIFADRVLHGGSRMFGWLMGASGVGALAGALILASRQSLAGLGRWVAIAGIGFGVGLGIFAFSRTFVLSSVMLVAMGFAVMLQMGSSNTLIQSMVPDRLRGRVMAVYSMMLMGMAPIGSLLAGAAADRIGAPWTVAAGAIICTIAASVFWIRLPLIRGQARKLIAAQQFAGDPPEALSEGSVLLKD
ncbi:MAG TPA: MFS transporter, partial [Bryobacteraceae bacterium]|nr:MFS transporter [Bryobacteraceae bacterium]